MPIPARRCGLVLFAATAFASAAAADTAPADAAVQKELVRLTQNLMDALVPGDAEVWKKTLADDAVIVDEFGRIQNKADAVAGIHAFPAGFSGSIEIRDAQVRVHGDAAVLQGEMYETETVLGQKLIVRYIFANTFVRRDGAWKLLAATDVTLPTPPPALSVDGIVPADYVGTYRYGPERAWTFAADGNALSFATKAGGQRTPVEAIARDVFMEGGDERNLLIFRRDASGRIVELIERRKFNDLHLTRDKASNKS